MMHSKLTFEQIPGALNTLLNEVGELKALLLAIRQPTVNSDPNPDIFINTKEAAKLLGLSDQSIYSMTFTKTIPHYKRGKKLQFSRSELLDWIKNSRISTAAETSKRADEFMLNRENQ
jgi:excisionase family DNA binding protein